MYWRSGSSCLCTEGIRRETKWQARNTCIKIGHLWEMHVGSQGGSALRIRWLQFYPPRGVGVRKDHLCLFLFLWVVAPSRYLFKSAEGQSSNSCLWSASGCRPHPIPHPVTWGISCASTSQAGLPCSDGFLEQLLTYSDFPKSSRFPSLSVVPSWDFCNYLCLLLPYQVSTSPDLPLSMSWLTGSSDDKPITVWGPPDLLLPGVSLFHIPEIRNSLFQKTRYMHF